jgi:hypothetical protein
MCGGIEKGQRIKNIDVKKFSSVQFSSVQFDVPGKKVSATWREFWRDAVEMNYNVRCEAERRIRSLWVES